MSRPVRILGAVCLVLTALLSVVSVVTQPEFVSDPAAQLRHVDEAGARAALSVIAFAFSQLPFMVGVAAAAALSHPRAPRLAWTAGVLAVLGGFGHSVFGGIGLAQLALAGDVTHRATMAEAYDRLMTGPAGPFSALGLLGTVLGLALLGVALFRSGVVARWVPVALWVFLVAEFALSNLTAWASPAAGLLYFAAFAALAVRLVRPRTGLPEEARGSALAHA